VKEATDRALWEQLAEYLFDGYKKAEGTRGAGNHLSIQTAQDYLKTAMQLAQAVHVGQPFFECLNPLVDKRYNADRLWFVNLREQMWKKFYVRAVKNGDTIDESAPPLGISHVKAMVAALSKFASKPGPGILGQTQIAHERKFSLLSLWQVAGRSGEIAWLSYKKLETRSSAACTSRLRR
jgi:hypothetical protein